MRYMTSRADIKATDAARPANDITWTITAELISGIITAPDTTNIRIVALHLTKRPKIRPTKSMEQEMTATNVEIWR